MKDVTYDDRVLDLLKQIRAQQQEPGGTGAPEGYCEMHEYHVWEVLNALKNEPLPTDEDGFIETSPQGEATLVKVTYYTDHTGRTIDPEKEEYPCTLHGPFRDEDEAVAWMEAWPDGDTDIEDMVTQHLNLARPT